MSARLAGEAARLLEVGVTGLADDLSDAAPRGRSVVVTFRGFAVQTGRAGQRPPIQGFAGGTRREPQLEAMVLPIELAGGRAALAARATPIGRAWVGRAASTVRQRRRALVEADRHRRG